MHRLIIDKFVCPTPKPSIFKAAGSSGNITLTRTFHPVGQGAFYSEVFSIDDREEFTVVYDCGTESDGASLDHEIDSFVKGLKNSKIDLLFISHFHKDHINGLPKLASMAKIKKTVIPMLPPEVLLVSRVHNYLTCEETTKEGRRKEIEPLEQIINDLTTHEGISEQFGEIVSVAPYDSDYRPDGWLPKSPRETVQAGKSLPGIIDIWKYIPFNSIDVGDDCAEKFKAAVSDLGLFNDGELIEEKLLHGLREEVKKLYKDIVGKLCADDNLYTMAVESLPADGYEIESLARESRCLFTGDLDSVGNAGLWGRFTHLFQFNDIGTIQVPHHGSKENWRPEFLTKDSKEFVVSVGEKNTYHHPDFWAMESIRKNDKLFVVTENLGSKKSDTFNVIA